MQLEKKKNRISNSYPDSSILPEYVLRHNIRVLSNFVSKWGDNDTIETVDGFIEEWNNELKRRGLKEEKYRTE
jgi:hypothetical protein